MPDWPPFFEPRPAMRTDGPTLAAFDALWDRIARGGAGELEYRLDAPRWQFLSHTADTRDVVLHGSGNTGIALFEPRKSNDVNIFGDRCAVYAASDGLWPMYFAILDRDRYQMSLINTAARVELGGGRLSDPRYFFSISREALENRPFRRGMIYLLPRAGFELQPPLRIGNRDVRVPQWASLAPVTPLARLAVGPEDFPLLDRIRGHDDGPTFARARANPDGFPWLEET